MRYVDAMQPHAQPHDLPRTYRVLRAVVRWALRLFFREIAVEGREHVPHEGGGLLVAWHPNGVIDPGLILAAFPRQVIFGARDGLLKWPIIGWVMRELGTVPIFRARDHAGESEEARREANEQSLGALAEAVAEGSFSALFPEGQSHDAPHVTPVRSGAARLYLRARDLARARTVDPGAAGAPPPALIPVGLHYDAKSVFRSDVLVVFHPPLPVAPDAAAREITDQIQNALVHAVHATEDWDLHRTMLRASALARAEWAAREGRRAEESVVHRTTDFEKMWLGYHARRETHPDEIQSLRREVTAYRRKLALLGMEDDDLDRPARSAPAQVARTVLQGALAYFILRPLFVVGMIVNAPTYWLLKPIARRFAKEEKDTATIKLLGGMVLYPLTWAVVAGLAVLGLAPLREFAPWVPNSPVAIALFAIVLSVVGGIVAVRATELTQETWRSLRARWTRRQHPEVVADLRRQRAALYDRLMIMAEGVEGVAVEKPTV